MNAYWLLRYPNGDAFALALLPYGYYMTWNEMRQQSDSEVRPPAAFKTVIHNYRDNICIRDYDYEVIPKIQWETLAEFGIPIVDEKTNDDGERWLEIH